MGRHLFRRETVPAFAVPGWDIRAGFSPRRHQRSRRCAAAASAGRRYELVLKAKSNRLRARGRVYPPAIHMSAPVSELQTSGAKIERASGSGGGDNPAPRGLQEGESPPFFLAYVLAVGRLGSVTEDSRQVIGPL